MAALVAVTMTLTATVLYQQQYAAMMDQVKDYGGSLAKFIATQNAVPLLSEDWAAIDVFIQETLGRQDFNYIARRRPPGHRARQQRAGAGQREIRAAASDSRCRRSGRRRQGAEPPARRRPRRARLRGAGPVPGQGDRRRCTSASTRRR